MPCAGDAGQLVTGFVQAAYCNLTTTAFDEEMAVALLLTLVLVGVLASPLVAALVSDRV